MMTFQQGSTSGVPSNAPCRQYSEFEFFAYMCAAREAFDPSTCVIPTLGTQLSFRNDVSAYRIGPIDGHDTTFDVLLLRLDDILEVMVFLEQEGLRGGIVYNGNRAMFERLAVELSLYESECFSHLRPAATVQTVAV